MGAQIKRTEVVNGARRFRSDKFMEVNTSYLESKGRMRGRYIGCNGKKGGIGNETKTNRR